MRWLFTSRSILWLVAMEVKNFIISSGRNILRTMDVPGAHSGRSDGVTPGMELACSQGDGVLLRKWLRCSPRVVELSSGYTGAASERSHTVPWWEAFIWISSFRSTEAPFSPLPEVQSLDAEFFHVRERKQLQHFQEKELKSRKAWWLASSQRSHNKLGETLKLESSSLMRMSSLDSFQLIVHSGNCSLQSLSDFTLPLFWFF